MKVSSSGTRGLRGAKRLELSVATTRSRKGSKGWTRLAYGVP